MKCKFNQFNLMLISNITIHRKGMIITMDLVLCAMQELYYYYHYYYYFINPLFRQGIELQDYNELEGKKVHIWLNYYEIEIKFISKCVNSI